MRNTLNKEKYKVTKDKAFNDVIQHCATAYRPGQKGTWITENMTKAYVQLYENGHAHSYEVWEEGDLVGGLYGIDLGHVFCGESMFSVKKDASKCALIHLAKELERMNYAVIDCQLHTDHLASLGAETISRLQYLEILKGIDDNGTP